MNAVSAACSRCARVLPLGDPDDADAYEDNKVYQTYDPFLDEVHEEKVYDLWCGCCWYERKDDV